MNDTTDGATGQFVGTSSGGTVSSDSSTIQISWTLPAGLTLGPNTTNALTGNFGTTRFSIVSPTSLIVAPNSGTPPGDTTIQGQVTSTTPEPSTMALFGVAVVGLGFAKRRRMAR